MISEEEDNRINYIMKLQMLVRKQPPCKHGGLALLVQVSLPLCH